MELGGSSNKSIFDSSVPVTPRRHTNYNQEIKYNNKIYQHAIDIIDHRVHCSVIFIRSFWD